MGNVINRSVQNDYITNVKITSMSQLCTKCGSLYVTQLHVPPRPVAGTSLLYLNERPPLWSSGQSSWLQIQMSGFDSRRYQIFWEVVGLERVPLSPLSTTEELLGRKRSGSGLENREYGRREPQRWPRENLYPQKLALTSPTSSGRSVGTVRSRTQATEYVFVLYLNERYREVEVCAT
jgi:hypothetical protein